MIDLYRHILPGIDDGDGSLVESHAMHKSWSRTGVQGCCCNTAFNGFIVSVKG